MKVLVTGGAGYIGSHTVLELIKAGYEVIVLDNLSTGNLEAIDKRAQFYHGNLEDKKILTKIFTENKVSAVIHCSAKLIVPESVKHPIIYFENNVHGLAVLLEQMNKNEVKNIVFSSTAAVYGNPVQIPIKEEDPKNPLSPYGQSKLACEWLIQGTHVAHDFNYVIFRYFNVAGADKSLNIGQSTKGPKLTHLIPVINEFILGERQELNAYGDDYETRDGFCIRDYIHVSDLARAHIKGVEYTLNDKSNIFNLGSNNGSSVKEIILSTAEIIQQEIPYKVAPRRSGDPAQLVASTDKVKEELGFNLKYSLTEIISSDLAWRKNKKF